MQNMPKGAGQMKFNTHVESFYL